MASFKDAAMRRSILFSLLDASPLFAQQPFTLDGVRRIFGVGEPAQ